MVLYKPWNGLTFFFDYSRFCFQIRQDIPDIIWISFDEDHDSFNPIVHGEDIFVSRTCQCYELGVDPAEHHITPVHFSLPPLNLVESITANLMCPA